MTSSDPFMTRPSRRPAPLEVPGEPTTQTTVLRLVAATAVSIGVSIVLAVALIVLVFAAWSASSTGAEGVNESLGPFTPLGLVVGLFLTVGSGALALVQMSRDDLERRRLAWAYSITCLALAFPMLLLSVLGLLLLPLVVLVPLVVVGRFASRWPVYVTSVVALLNGFGLLMLMG